MNQQGGVVVAVRADLAGAEWVVASDGKRPILVIDLQATPQRAAEIEELISPMIASSITIRLPGQRINES